MTRKGMTILTVALAATVACSRSADPNREAIEGTRGTAGRDAGEVTVTGCLALGQMGTYMLTSEANIPREQGLGRAAATTGYQLLGQPADFNQYMNKRVRVTGTLAGDAPDRSVTTRGRDSSVEAPWPKLQVREVDPIGGECPTK